MNLDLRTKRFNQLEWKRLTRRAIKFLIWRAGIYGVTASYDAKARLFLFQLGDNWDESWHGGRTCMGSFPYDIRFEDPTTGQVTDEDEIKARCYFSAPFYIESHNRTNCRVLHGDELVAMLRSGRKLSYWQAHHFVYNLEKARRHAFHHFYFEEGRGKALYAIERKAAHRGLILQYGAGRNLGEFCVRWEKERWANGPELPSESIPMNVLDRWLDQYEVLFGSGAVSPPIRQRLKDDDDSADWWKPRADVP